MDRLSALTAFVRAAELRSFTDAGRQLRLSSSAIGKAISRLEERHGVRLFHRNTRSVTLTQEGQIFLESCKRIISEMENVERGFAQTKTAAVGKLKVSMPSLGGAATSVLSRFMREYREIELDVEFSAQPNDVIDGGYDVAIRVGEVDDSRLMTRKICSYLPTLVCSAAYLKRMKSEPDQVSDLLNHACLHLKDAVTGKLERWPFANPKMAAQMLPVAAVANTTEAIVAFAELGMGIACVPDFTVQRQVECGSLRTILAGCLEYQGSLRAIWPSNSFPSPRLRAFIEFITEHGFKSPDVDVAKTDVEGSLTLSVVR
jgi:DNA-binding transcriptional LysR family regulator